jgi:hypothetical protein
MHTDEQFKACGTIIDGMAAMFNPPYSNPATLVLDLIFIHDYIAILDLTALAAAPLGELAADLRGIKNHFDRKARCFRAGFMPAYATPRTDAAISCSPAP